MNRRNFKTADKLAKRITENFAKQHSLENEWDGLKAKLEDAGTWEEYCEARGWSTECSFADFGA